MEPVLALARQDAKIVPFREVYNANRTSLATNSRQWRIEWRVTVLFGLAFLLLLLGKERPGSQGELLKLWGTVTR